jgi:hypothetical protein
MASHSNMSVLRQVTDRIRYWVTDLLQFRYRETAKDQLLNNEVCQ